MLDLRFTAGRIKALRKNLGLTQQQFGDRLGVRQTTVAHWERGTRTPTGYAALEALLSLEHGELPEVKA
ncbi:hypothetical protein LCGC14_2112860 [marine sediment metagenome]|uniref:HTH cro/C1-type domain-containing protein n=1 Tax=marine sediment metagenome TaxID=412755 RepID=A0A0F9E6I8_9ZZZZ